MDNLRKQITKRQKDLLNIIYDYIKNTGYAPTFQEMKEELKVSSNQSVIDHLENLKERNFINHTKGTARSITIMPIGYQVLEKPPLANFAGATSAGAMIEALEIPSEWQAISKEIAQPKNNIFLLKVSGDSMINAGIDDGDIILVEEEEEFISGDIVLAEKEGESTIKRFISEDKSPYIYLKPENPKYKNILFTEETRLKGKVISVLKNGFWKPIK